MKILPLKLKIPLVQNDTFGATRFVHHDLIAYNLMVTFGFLCDSMGFSLVFRWFLY